MAFEIDCGKAVKSLPCGDRVEITSTMDGFRLEVSFLDSRGKKRRVFCKDYTSKELTGLEMGTSE